MAIKEKNKFDKWNDWLTNMEGSMVNLASTFVPWITPLAPMVMTFGHAVEIFGGGTWGIIWAIPVAATVELLGLATVSTMIRFWMHNQRKNLAQYKKAPTWAATLMFSFYLALVLSTNVLLDLGPVLGIPTKYVEIVVKALFTLQTIPGAVIVAIRFAHRELLEGNSILTSTSTSTSVPTSSSTFNQNGSKNGSKSGTSKTRKKKIGSQRKPKEIVYTFIQNIYDETRMIPTFSEIVDATKLPDSTVSRLRTAWLQENPQVIAYDK